MCPIRQAPHEIAFLHMPGFGAHRIWWVGGRYAYVSVHFEGFIDHALAVVDVSDPDTTEARRSLVVTGHEPGGWRDSPGFVRQAHGTASSHQRGKSRLCSMARRRFHRSRSERPAKSEAAQPPQLRAAVRRRRAYAIALTQAQTSRAWRDEATSANCANGLAYTWLIDVREPSNPVSIATLPTPAEEDFAPRAQNSDRTICMKTGRARCNRKSSFSPPTTMPDCGSTIFAMPFQPKEVGYFVPPPPERIVDQRPNPAKGHSILRRICRSWMA